MSHSTHLHRMHPALLGLRNYISRVTSTRTQSKQSEQSSARSTVLTTHLSACGEALLGWTQTDSRNQIQALLCRSSFFAPQVLPAGADMAVLCDLRGHVSSARTLIVSPLLFSLLLASPLLSSSASLPAEWTEAGHPVLLLSFLLCLSLSLSLCLSFSLSLSFFSV